MHRLRADLIAAGLDMWTDEALEPGTPEGENAIEDAGCMVVILSPGSRRSTWVRRDRQSVQTCRAGSASS